MEKVNMKVSGMSCTNCALTINKYLKSEGLQNVQVNFIGGDVSFEMNGNITKQKIEQGIEKLGYQVKHENVELNHTNNFTLPFKSHLQRFWFCIVFTTPLLMHMIPGLHIHVLMNPYLQLVLTIPVYIVGMDFFGRSAIKSLFNGIPNMNVLITIGFTAAFGYSLYGLIINNAAEYLFFETACTTLTLVFLGNYMEDIAIKKTQDAIKKLAVSQKVMANMIAFDDQHQEQVFQVENTALHVGDLVLIRDGEYVPMDCKILWGEANVNESIITGESISIEKKMKDLLIGGSIIENGTVKAQITAVGEDTVLSHILKLVKAAQTEKPPVQQLADKISAVFVPAVISIAFLTCTINYFFVDKTFGESLLRSIVFDKTGTLTTGKFQVISFKSLFVNDEEFKRIIYSIEKYSNHPIAKAIVKEWKIKDEIRWSFVEEIKGIGIKSKDKESNEYFAGSYSIAKRFTKEDHHNIYLLRNNELIGWVDVADEIREEAKQVISLLKSQNIKTILLSGDKKEKSEKVGNALGIDEIIFEQSPEQKLEKIAAYKAIAPTAMVGDGINDAPALAKATVGISLSDASQVALQSAQVVLMNHGLKNLPLALGLGKKTYQTIQGNLFWAFAYNIVAIPIAAFGFLSPTLGAMVMGLSDVVLAINSIWLNFKKVV